jgi:hypothetical protein
MATLCCNKKTVSYTNVAPYVPEIYMGFYKEIILWPTNGGGGGNDE